MYSGKLSSRVAGLRADGLHNDGDSVYPYSRKPPTVGVRDASMPRLPGIEPPEQIVCHVDMDCFYAACERLREPDLEGELLAVGMRYEPGETHGAVATASYEARECGVESAITIST
jgi:hypothetical protein